MITDEAHRSQYDDAGAEHAARPCPNAAFMGFTGTPLIEGEGSSRGEVFGDYVSTYNFRDAIEDGATVPLFYENRIPELQLVNEDFDDELTGILEEAELDDDAGGAARPGASPREYQLITRPERLRTDRRATSCGTSSAAGFVGKAMFVAIDKATAVRMHDLVAEEWADHLAELRERADDAARAGADRRRGADRAHGETDMAVVVSSPRTRSPTCASTGLDIRPHRQRMNEEDLDERFKDPERPAFGWSSSARCG